MNLGGIYKSLFVLSQNLGLLDIHHQQKLHSTSLSIISSASSYTMPRLPPAEKLPLAARKNRKTLH